MWIKICGIRDLSTALMVATLKPHAIGLNFYQGSPRYVVPEIAAKIVRVLPEEITPVGLFVNHSPVEIEQICQECRLDTIQLHGDEPPELLAELKAKDALKLATVIRAFRLGEEGLEPLALYLEQCRRLEALPAACLIDAKVEGTYGGSGRTAPWSILQRDYPLLAWPKLILAGGLHPANVAAAVQAVNPWGVDVASGVESSAAVKDPGLVQTFIANASALRQS